MKGEDRMQLHGIVTEVRPAGVAPTPPIEVRGPTMSRQLATAGPCGPNPLSGAWRVSVPGATQCR